LVKPYRDESKQSTNKEQQRYDLGLISQKSEQVGLFA
jgi:hypothetical protein